MAGLKVSTQHFLVWWLLQGPFTPPLLPSSSSLPLTPSPPPPPAPRRLYKRLASWHRSKDSVRRVFSLVTSRKVGLEGPGSSWSHRDLGKVSSKTIENLPINHFSVTIPLKDLEPVTGPQLPQLTSGLTFHFPEICLPASNVQMNAMFPSRLYEAVWLGETSKMRRSPRPWLWPCPVEGTTGAAGSSSPLSGPPICSQGPRDCVFLKNKRLENPPSPPSLKKEVSCYMQRQAQ